jgi:hypothetical protein
MVINYKYYRDLSADLDLQFFSYTECMRWDITWRYWIGPGRAKPSDYLGD